MQCRKINWGMKEATRESHAQQSSALDHISKLDADKSIYDLRKSDKTG
jgi:hypothetical protein